MIGLMAKSLQPVLVGWWLEPVCEGLVHHHDIARDPRAIQNCYTLMEIET